MFLYIYESVIQTVQAYAREHRIIIEHLSQFSATTTTVMMMVVVVVIVEKTYKPFVQSVCVSCYDAAHAAQKIRLPSRRCIFSVRLRSIFHALYMLYMFSMCILCKTQMSRSGSLYFYICVWVYRCTLQIRCNNSLNPYSKHNSFPMPPSHLQPLDPPSPPDRTTCSRCNSTACTARMCA